MPHHSRLYKAVIDVAAEDHDRELAFWQAATGQPLEPFDDQPEYHGTKLDGQDFALLTQRIDEGTSRVHLDIHSAGYRRATGRRSSGSWLPRGGR